MTCRMWIGVLGGCVAGQQQANMHEGAKGDQAKASHVCMEFRGGAQSFFFDSVPTNQLPGRLCREAIAYLWAYQYMIPIRARGLQKENRNNNSSKVSIQMTKFIF